jgi:hypothetical protein
MKKGKSKAKKPVAQKPKTRAARAPKQAKLAHRAKVQ